MQRPITSRAKRYNDERGWFLSSFSELHPDHDWKMQNVSFSKKNTLRGLHFQYPASLAQTKLITVLEGNIVDVVLDIDSESATYGEWLMFELSSCDMNLPNQIYVPSHYAHGFLVKSDSATVSYLTDEIYHPEAELSIHALSPGLAIPWKVTDPIMSDKDSKAESWILTKFNKST